MNNKIKNILINANYYIEYNYLGDNKSDLYVSWEKQKITFVYDKEFKILKTEDNSIIIENCPDYCTGIIINLFCRKICETRKYSFDLLIRKKHGNLINGFYFGDSENDEKGYILNEIYTEILNSGLNPAHVDLVQENNLQDGFTLIMELMFGMKVEIL